MLTWLCLATVSAYVTRSCIAVAEKDIRDDLGLSEATMGDIMAAFFLTYALFQVPTGWLGHVWGTRRALPVFVALWSAFTAVAALSVGVPWLLVSRLGSGAAQAGIFPCATNTLSYWFPPSQRAIVSGFLGSFMGIGGALGAALTGVLLYRLDWRTVFVLFALPGFVWAVWFAWWFRDRPEEHDSVDAGELALLRPDLKPDAPAVRQLPEPTPWGRIFASPTMWGLSAQQFMRGAGYVFYISWFATYLRETRGVSTSEAGWLTSLPFWAQVVGCLVGGVAADAILARTGSLRLSRQGVPFVSLTACAVLIVLSSLIANPWLAVSVIALGAFCSSLAGPCAYAASIDLGGNHVASVFAVMNMAGNVGAILLPVAVPRLVAATGNWHLALLLFAGVHLAGAVCWLFINPEGTIVPRCERR